MNHEMQHARIAGPVQYAAGGRTQDLPLGPCLMERVGERRVDIIWGERGEHSAEVPIAEIKRAADDGDLLLVD